MIGPMRTGFRWIAIILGIASLVLFAAAAYGYRIDHWPWPQAFDLARTAVRTGMAGAGFAVLGLIAWTWRRGRGLRVILLALVLSLPMTVLGVVFDVSARITPPINDISTDTVDPPVFWYTVTPTEYPPANAALQIAAYQNLAPLTLPMPFDAAFDTVLALVDQRGWRILSDSREEAQIETIATSPVFGFEDEVAIRLTDHGDATRIDMRSRSRIGRVDRGANARRITGFLSDLSSGIQN